MKAKPVRKVNLLFVDLETKSSHPIGSGVTNYFDDKDADWLICAAVNAKGKAVVYDNLLSNKKIPKSVIDFKGVFVAHNWFFEWSFFNKFYPGTRAADFRNWLCTAAMSRWFGVCAPRAKLEECAHALGLQDKMPEGSSLIAKYSCPQKDGTFRKCTDPADRAMFLKYCETDAHLSRGIYNIFDGHGFNVEEFRAAQAIDVRGVPVDVDAARFLLERKTKDKAEAFEKAEAIAGRTKGGALVLSSNDGFITFMKDEFGIDIPNARTATLEEIDFSGHADSARVENVLYIRKLLTARAGDKAEKILELQNNNRVRSTTVFHAAGTGRFQSWGVNFFNFSRQSVEDWEKEKHTASVPALQRGVICAPKGKVLIESDWRGIENYLSLFFAGDTEQLRRIEAGESPYLIFAEKMYGETITKADPRYILAKASVLGFGYGAGAKKFAMINRFDYETAKRLQVGWQKINAPIVKLWYDFSNAFLAATRGATVETHGFTFAPLGSGQDIKIILLDGHVIYYRNITISADDYGRPLIKRDGQTVHGGLITENLMQATCARLLYRALAACEKAGLEAVLHIYDSIIIEVDKKDEKKASKKLADIMKDAPPWCPDLRLGVDVKAGRRWSK